MLICYCYFWELIHIYIFFSLLGVKRRLKHSIYQLPAISHPSARDLRSAYLARWINNGLLIYQPVYFLPVAYFSQKGLMHVFTVFDANPPNPQFAFFFSSFQPPKQGAYAQKVSRTFSQLDGKTGNRWPWKMKMLLPWELLILLSLNGCLAGETPSWPPFLLRTWSAHSSYREALRLSRSLFSCSPNLNSWKSCANSQLWVRHEYKMKYFTEKRTSELFSKNMTVCMHIICPFNEKILNLQKLFLLLCSLLFISPIVSYHLSQFWKFSEWQMLKTCE